MLRQQLGEGVVWSITGIEFTVLTVFRYLGAYGDSTAGLTCRDDGMCRNGQGVPVPLATNFCKCIDEIGLSGVLEGSSFDPVSSVIDVARPAEVDWTGLAPLETRFPHLGETGEVIDSAVGRTMQLRRRPLDGRVPLIGKTPLARAVLFAVDQMHSMEDACARIFRSSAVLGSASAAVGGYSCKDELAPYPVDGDGNDWDFADAAVLSHVKIISILQFYPQVVPFGQCCGTTGCQ